MDSTLNPVTSFDAVPHWLSPGDCSMNYTIFGGDKVQSAGCKTVFKALAEDPEEFSRALEEVLSGPFAVQKIQAAIDGYSAFLSPHISKSVVDDEAAWRQGVSKLRGDIPALHSKARGYKTT